MNKSYLQDEFLKVVADGHCGTAERIVMRLVAAGIVSNAAEAAKIVNDELRGCFHGTLVVLDGGSSLADQGLIKIVDDQGTPFVSYLHEIGFDAYDEVARARNM